ncbi:MAG TPA: DUF881 domain-containing protein [Aeromicrobium sp.]|nr:DUF881 domain-containing protein [Aeromicrobium sp.]
MTEQDSTSRKWSLLAVGVSCFCGVAFVAAAVTSNGSDLRPAGGNIESVLAGRTKEVESKRQLSVTLQTEIDKLSKRVDDAALKAQVARAKEAAGPAGMTAVRGPGIRVTLDDAPSSVNVPGLDPNLLVVHQQDLQAFVNALWAGGAEAVTLQGQRLTTIVGIKCVGNTVVLDGVPYAPPYVIEAIGNQSMMASALVESPEVQIYTDYANRYGLGLEQENRRSIKAPASSGTISLNHARPFSG